MAAQLIKKLNSEIVVVLGMHRSGTSLCSHILQDLGIYMADEATPAPDNEEGHWERWELVSLHDRLLHHFDRSYFGVGSYSPKHDLPLPDGWLTDSVTDKIFNEMCEFITSKIGGDRLLGFKDPRTCRLLPLWWRVFSELNLKPKFIICVRNPVDVSRSLYQRDKIPEKVGHYRWLLYNCGIFNYIRGEYCVVDYASWFSAPDETISRIQQFLFPRSPFNRIRQFLFAKPSSKLNRKTVDLIKPKLNHGYNPLNDTRNNLTFGFYEQIRKLETRATDKQEIERFAASFHDFQHVVPWSGFMN